MSDNNNFEQAMAVYAAIFALCIFMGAAGFVVHSLIVLPIKFCFWAVRGDRSHPDNLLIFPKINMVTIGICVFAIPFYVSECVIANEFDYEWYHHAITISFILIPLVSAIVGVHKEFMILTEPIGEEHHLTGTHLFWLAMRFVAGIAAGVMLILAVIDSLNS